MKLFDDVKEIEDVVVNIEKTIENMFAERERIIQRQDMIRRRIQRKAKRQFTQEKIGLFPRVFGVNQFYDPEISSAAAGCI